MEIIKGLNINAWWRLQNQFVDFLVFVYLSGQLHHATMKIKKK